MTPEIKALVLENAKQVFFEAILDGYAGGGNRKSTKISSNSGHTKTVTFTSGDFRVEDSWHTTPLSDHSAGTTTIFWQEIPVWHMSYGGHYPEAAIPLLKLAMAQAYKRKLFLGGRGPAKVTSVEEINGLKFNLTYINDWRGDFNSFDGFEKIVQNPLAGYDPELIGYHKYFGMSLF